MKVSGGVESRNRSGIDIFCWIIWKIWLGYEKIHNRHLIPFSFQIQWKDKYTEKDWVYKYGSQCIFFFKQYFISQTKQDKTAGVSLYNVFSWG